MCVLLCVVVVGGCCWWLLCVVVCCCGCCASQQACLPLWPSTHRRRSSESARSYILFNHSWTSSSQSFQKETGRTYHLLMLRFTFVSTKSGSRLQCTNSNAWNSFRFTTLVKCCARSNTGQHVSFPQSNDRGIVTVGKPISPNHIIG